MFDVYQPILRWYVLLAVENFIRKLGGRFGWQSQLNAEHYDLDVIFKTNRHQPFTDTVRSNNFY